MLALLFIPSTNANVFAQGATLSPSEEYLQIATRDQREQQAANIIPLPETLPPSPAQRIGEPMIAQSMAPNIEPSWNQPRPLKIPNRFSLEPYLPQPGKQGPNDCVAWAIAHASYTCQIAQERRRAPVAMHDLFSPSFIYTQLQESGQGLVPIQAINFVKRVGCASQASFDSQNNRINKKAHTEATTYRAARSERARNLADIQSFLVEGYPVILIVRMGGDFRSDSPIEEPYRWSEEQNPRDGYHAITAVGYDSITESILIMNSWGTDWKSEGFCWVHYDNLENINANSWCAEAHVIGVKNCAPYNVSMTPKRGPTTRSRSGKNHFSRRVFRLDTDRKVYEGDQILSPTSWVFDDIACSRDQLFVLGRNQKVFRMNEEEGDQGIDRSWTHLNQGVIAGKKVTMMASDTEDLIHALTSDNELFQYSSSSRNWIKTKLPKANAFPVDLRAVDGETRVTASDGSVFIQNTDASWTLAP